MSFSNRRVHRHTHTHGHTHTAKGKVLTAETTSGNQSLFLAALLLFSINPESDDFILQYPTEHLNVKDVCFFCRTVTLGTRFYLFSEVDDDVRGSGQSFFLLGPQSRKRTWRQEKQKSISAFNKSEFLLRVSAAEPPHRWDSSRGWRSFEVWEELQRTGRRPEKKREENTTTHEKHNSNFFFYTAPTHSNSQAALYCEGPQQRTTPYDRGKNNPRWMKVNFQESRICILRSTL